MLSSRSLHIVDFAKKRFRRCAPVLTGRRTMVGNRFDAGLDFTKQVRSGKYLHPENGPSKKTYPLYPHKALAVNTLHLESIPCL